MFAFKTPGASKLCLIGIVFGEGHLQNFRVLCLFHTQSVLWPTAKPAGPSAPSQASASHCQSPWEACLSSLAEGDTGETPVASESQLSLLNVCLFLTLTPLLCAGGLMSQCVTKTPCRSSFFPSSKWVLGTRSQVITLDPPSHLESPVTTFHLTS